MDNQTKEMSDMLYSINKKAKNLRDKQIDMVRHILPYKTKSNKKKLETEFKEIEEQKNKYYEQKDYILKTYFEPECIHREVLEYNQYEYISNFQGVNVNQFMEESFYQSFTMMFLNEKYEKSNKKMKTVYGDTKRRCFVFNNVIIDEEIKESICEDILKEHKDIIIKGNKIYIPTYKKVNFDNIFMKYLVKKDFKHPSYEYKRIYTYKDICIYRKAIQSETVTKYYLFYRIGKYSFHRPIDKSELKDYKNLKIYKVSLDTKGSDERLYTDNQIGAYVKNL